MQCDGAALSCLAYRFGYDVNTEGGDSTSEERLRKSPRSAADVHGGARASSEKLLVAVVGRRLPPTNR